VQTKVVQAETYFFIESHERATTHLKWIENKNAYHRWNSGVHIRITIYKLARRQNSTVKNKGSWKDATKLHDYHNSPSYAKNGELFNCRNELCHENKRWTKSKTNKKWLGKTSGNACTSSTFYLTTHYLQIQNALVLTLSQKDDFISGGEENHGLWHIVSTRNVRTKYVCNGKCTKLI